MNINKRTVDFIVFLVFSMAFMTLLFSCSSGRPPLEKTNDHACPDGKVYSYSSRNCVDPNDYP